MNRPVVLAWLGLALGSLCWAGNTLIARAFAAEIPPITLAFWRWALAAVILLPFIARSLRQHWPALRRAGWRLWVLAGVSIAAYNCLLYSAAHSTAAINLSLVGTCMPLAIFVGAGLLLNEWPSRQAWLGLGVAMLGLIWLIAQGSVQVLTQLSFAQGDLIMIIATFSWALYSVLLRRWKPYLQVPGFTLLGILILLGLVLMLPVFFWEYSQGARLALTPSNIAAVVYTAIFASLVAYHLWNHGVATLGAAKAGISNYLMPVLVALLAWLVLGEGLQSYHWIGGALILCGVLLAGRASGKAKTA